MKIEKASFRSANNYFRENKFQLALEEYRRLKIIYPSLKNTIESQIKLCEKRINDIENKKFNEIFHHTGTGWSAVITIWKRAAYLEEQLDAISSQSIPPNEIIIIQNENNIEINRNLLKKFNVRKIQSDINSLYTRWIVGYILDCKYVCVFDDDVIPGKKWIENCIRACEVYNALVGPSGRIAKPHQTPSWISVEPISKNPANILCAENDVICDWVCNSYFFKTEWITHITKAGRYLQTQKTFDDIQLAVTLKQYGGIRTVVPHQPINDKQKNGHLKREYGHDEHALWKRQKSEHLEKRGKLIADITTSDFAWNSKEIS